MKRILALSILALCGYSTVTVASDAEKKTTFAASMSLSGTHSELETKTRAAQISETAGSASGSSAATQEDRKRQSDSDAAYFNAMSGDGVGAGAQSLIPKPLASKKQISKELAEQMLASTPEVNDIIKKIVLKVPGAPTKILLFGPPGTGKTTLVKAIAEALKWPCYMYDGASIGNEYQNAGCLNLERIFADAKKDNKPCVISIDELQLLVNKHNNPRLDDASMLTKLWKLLDEYIDDQMIFIGTANYVADMPENFIRRFDEPVEVVAPEASLREAIIKFYCQQLKITAEKNFVSDISAATYDFSNRDLEILMKKLASSIAISPKKTITESEWRAAISKMRNVVITMQRKAPKAPEKESLELQRSSLSLQEKNLALIKAGLNLQTEIAKKQHGMAQTSQLMGLLSLLSSDS